MKQYRPARLSTFTRHINNHLVAVDRAPLSDESISRLWFWGFNVLDSIDVGKLVDEGHTLLAAVGPDFE